MNHITSIGLDVHARSVTAVATCQGTEEVRSTLQRMHAIIYVP